MSRRGGGGIGGWRKDLMSDTFDGIVESVPHAAVSRLAS
jgi:hypothetical protein